METAQSELFARELQQLLSQTIKGAAIGADVERIGIRVAVTPAVRRGCGIVCISDDEFEVCELEYRSPIESTEIRLDRNGLAEWLEQWAARNLDA